MSDFEWPWEYSFPPFFTIQPHAKTLEHQISTWTNLIIKYHKHNKTSTCFINEDNELFKNTEINRKLPIEGRVQVLEELERRGYAVPFDKKKSQWQIYWYPLEEMGELIYRYASDSGLTNTVCTLFELAQGDSTVDQEFYGVDNAVLIAALKTLEAKSKCELIISDEIEGVKFF